MPFTAAHLRANWKTTGSGLLVLLLSLQHAVQFNAAGRLAMTQRDWFTVLIGLGAAGLGLIQQDAGSTVVSRPDGALAAEPSHEVPNDPANQPVATN